MPNHLSSRGAFCARVGRSGISRKRTKKQPHARVGDPPDNPWEDLENKKARGAPKKPAGKRNQRGLNQKLADVPPPPGAEAPPPANLPRALEKGRQHDVHDPNPA